MSFIYYLFEMQKVDLFNSKRIIVSCRDFKSKNDSSTYFEVKFYQVSFDENHKSDSWKLIPQDWFWKVVFSKKSLWSQFDKLSDAEICQELIWKSVLITTSLGD